jgi:chromosome segregation ATPase
MAEKSHLSTNLDDLDLQKGQLETELSSLDSNYQRQISENDHLSVTLEERVKEIENLKSRVWAAKQKITKSEEENKAINEKLVQLETLKEDLENDIVSLNETNQDLIATNEKMANDLQISKEETSALSEQLAEMSTKNEALIKRLYTLAPAGFVANNFTVTAARKNDKLTAKAKQAEKINVSFDINDVPNEYQQEEEIYLVLTKFDGDQVQEIPVNEVELASINPVTINVVNRTKMTLKDRQNIEMSFDADRDLDSGLYNVLVYADHGFLGSTTFQLQ